MMAAMPHNKRNALDLPKRDPSVNPLHPSVLGLLDPAFVRLYNDRIAHTAPSLDLRQVRLGYSTLYSYVTAPATGVGGIGETTVPGWDKYPGDVEVRVYVPPGEEPGERKVWPVHFNFHGGGWAVGDLETDAHLCHHVCASVPCCVIDINYRLVPEYPFPIGIMDAWFAVRHILANAKCFSIDTSRVTLGGASTGGTISLILCHLFRDAGMTDTIKGVIVGTPPITDVKKFATAEQSPYPSMQEAEFAPLLNWAKLKWFETLKWMSLSSVPREARAEAQKDVSWYIDAMTAPNFENLAPLTWVGTAECDPLRDEAEAYAEKMKEHGNNVIMRRFKGVPHPFMHMDEALSQGREYVQETIKHIRMCQYPPPPQASAPGQETPTAAVPVAPPAAVATPTLPKPDVP